MLGMPVEVYSNGTQYIIFIVSAVLVQYTMIIRTANMGTTNFQLLFLAVGIGAIVHLFTIIFQLANYIKFLLLGTSFRKTCSVDGQWNIRFQESLPHSTRGVCAITSSKSR